MGEAVENILNYTAYHVIWYNIWIHQYPVNCDLAHINCQHFTDIAFLIWDQGEIFLFPRLWVIMLFSILSREDTNKNPHEVYLSFIYWVFVASLYSPLLFMRLYWFLSPLSFYHLYSFMVSTIQYVSPVFIRYLLTLTCCGFFSPFLAYLNYIL